MFLICSLMFFFILEITQYPICLLFVSILFLDLMCCSLFVRSALDEMHMSVMSRVTPLFFPDRYHSWSWPSRVVPFSINRFVALWDSWFSKPAFGCCRCMSMLIAPPAGDNGSSLHCHELLSAHIQGRFWLLAAGTPDDGGPRCCRQGAADRVPAQRFTGG